MTKPELMKEKSNLIKKINHLSQGPEVSCEQLEAINKKLQEIIKELLVTYK